MTEKPETKPADLWSAALEAMQQALEEPEDIAALCHLMADDAPHYREARDAIWRLQSAVEAKGHAARKEKEFARRHSEEETTGVVRYLKPSELN